MTNRRIRCEARIYEQKLWRRDDDKNSRNFAGCPDCDFPHGRSVCTIDGMAPLPALKRLLGSQQTRVWSWVVLCGILMFVAAVRFRLRDMPLERDEGEYAYAGRLFLQGVPPDKLAYTIKLPGTHAAYAILMLLFGQSCSGIHLGFLLVNWATIVLLFLLGRTLAGELTACIAAAAYALMSLSGDALGTAAHATHFVMLTALAGILLLFQASKNGKLPLYFTSGFLLSVSVLMKHNGLLFLAFGCFWLLWLGYSKTLGPNATFLKAGPVFLLGALAPFVFLLLLLGLAGTLKTCWFWSVTYARAYAKPDPGMMIVQRMLMQRMPEIMTLPFYAGFLGLVTSWLRRSSWPAALFASGFYLSSLLAVVPGLHFRPHYFIVLMPALALLIGILVQQTTDFLRKRVKWLAPIPVLAFALFFAKGVVHEQKLFFQLTPVDACRSLYGFQPFTEATILGDYIRTHSSPGASIAVLGSEPEIYFYSHRRSATGYIYTYPLTEHQPFAPQMQQQMKDEIQTAQPQFIIWVRTWTSWLSRPGPLNRIDRICENLMPDNYKLVGTCDVFPDESRVEWNWRSNPSTETTNPSTQLLIFERTFDRPEMAH